MVTRTRPDVTCYVNCLSCRGRTSERTEKRPTNLLLDSPCFEIREKSSNSASDVTIGPQLPLWASRPRPSVTSLCTSGMALEWT